MSDLPQSTHEEIRRLCAEGDALAEKSRYPDAIELYWSAWDLLPEPKTEWDAATWILVAIGDANFQSGDYEAGRDNSSMAMQCPNAIGNPFVHLRLGQCQFELGGLDRAIGELTRAYIGHGEDIFKDNDPKYLAFLKTKLLPPANGWTENESKKSW